MKGFLKRVLKKNKKIKELDIIYSFGKYEIVLPNNHALKKYQSKFPLYDRFIPLLCANFEGLIIDIGANIGDTSLAIFSKNSKSFIVGVEPDDIFFSECEHNIRRNELDNRFLGIKKFVSTNIGNYLVEKSSSLSTGSISLNTIGKGESNTISFSDLISSIPTEEKVKFDLLKIDTDGFDWDVLSSFGAYLNNLEIELKPKFVFFEMQTYENLKGFHDANRDGIIDKYRIAIEMLFENGYNCFCLLDNFGTPIKVTQSISDIFDINEYIKRSQIYNSYATIYYLDILAFSVEELPYVTDSIESLFNYG